MDRKRALIANQGFEVWKDFLKILNAERFFFVASPIGIIVDNLDDFF